MRKAPEVHAFLASQIKSNFRLSLNPIALTRSRLMLLVVMVAGSIFRFFLIGKKSIWLDEAYSIAITQRSLIDLLRMTVLTDSHPPLYYLLLKTWLLFSESEAWARSLSAFFSILSIPVMYLLVREVYQDKKAGLLGASLLAFSPFQIWYAQEARMYSALTFFVLASAFFFFRALEKNAVWDWAGYGLMTSLALYTDNGAIWYLATLVSFSILFMGRYWDRAAGWLLSHLAIGLSYVIWLPFLYQQTRQVTESFWLPPPSFQTVFNTFLDFHSYNFPWIEVSVLYMAAIFVFAYIVPGKSLSRQLASLWLFLPLVISLLLSLRQPIFLSRNLIAASLGYYLLTVDTIWKFRTRKAILIFLIPLLAMNLISIGYNTWFEEKENWREAAGLVAGLADRKPDGLIVFVPGFAELPFSYYFDDYQQPIHTQGYPGDELLLHPEPKQSSEVSEMLEGYPYVWLVIRQGESLEQDWVQLKEWLDSNGYERYPGFEQENVIVYSYFRWDKVKARQIRNRVQSFYSQFLPLNMKNYTTRYIVQADETLLEIAIRFQTTVEALVDANDLDNPNKLIPGQLLTIP
jgi:mannosyltransferase